MRRKGRPQRIGDLVSGFLDQAGLADRVRQAAIIPDWERLVGPQIAAVTSPIAVTRDGTLFVAVRTNAWMNELSMMERQLLSTLNAHLGPGAPPIVRIRWRLMAHPAGSLDRSPGDRAAGS